jgi:hypothetical protein
VDFYKRIGEMQGTVEDIVRQVPGFKGYFEKQDRRMADKLLREKLARTFNEQLSEFSRAQKKLVDGGGIKYMERVQNIDTRLRTFIDKIESAAYGYAGLFDALKVDEKVLGNVYAFDNGLLAYQDQLSSGIQALKNAVGSENVPAVLDQLDDLVTELTRVFDRRVEVLQGVEPAK